MNSIIEEGNIVTFMSNNTRYRVITIQPEYVALCRLDTTKLDIMEMSKDSLFNLLDADVVIEQGEKPRVVDCSEIAEYALSRYEMKKQLFNDIRDTYGPSYIGLTGKHHKIELYEILEKYDISKAAFWRTCLRYIQSGFDENALLDTKTQGINKGKTYNIETKPGVKSKYFAETGVIVDEKIKRIFDEAIKDYKSGRHKSLRSAYDNMNNRHFTRTEIVNGVTSLVLSPINERPTFKQFYYYVNKHINQEERDIIKTSQMEYRNNHRLLNSDTLYNVAGPGDLVEIDACEADVSLVSSLDCSRAIGRPIVYFMIDVYSRIILAVSIAFDNNSILGITSLFLNLADNKREFCERYGIGFDDERIWPSCIIPNRLRVDRGSEFKSKEFDRICLALGIEKDIVPAGSGSLKGVVEQSFHQMHARQNVHLEDKGLIEKRYDSKHHEEATLTIENYTKMVINFVLTHNQQYLETYPITKNMTEEKIKAIPATLWEYGINNCMNPRPIKNYEQYYYDLMTPIKAKVSRKGIEYKELFYISDDPFLTKCRIKAGTKKIPFEARMDMRDVGAVYYLCDGKLIKATLNEMITGNADYKYLTMKQWEDYNKEKKRLHAEGLLHNQELSAYNYAVNESIVSDAIKSSPPTITSKKNMRQTREIEKQSVSSKNRIETRIDTSENDIKPVEISEHIEVNTVTGENLTLEERRAKLKSALKDCIDE